MSDIVERLRTWGKTLAESGQKVPAKLNNDAANEIERLRYDLKYDRELIRYLQYYRDHVVDHDRALDAAAAKHADKLEARGRAYEKKLQEGSK